MKQMVLIGVALALVVGGVGKAKATNLLVNGGFETGDFTGWTLGGVQDGNTFVSNSPNLPYSGNYAAQLGAVGGDNTLSQTFNTVAGQTYDFQFFYLRDGGLPSDLHVFWNGTDIYDEVNSAAHDYQQHDFFVTATTASTTIEFDSRNDPSYDALDNVSVSEAVSAAPEPTTLTLAGLNALGLVGFAWWRRRKQTA
jgi:MYXO-CTERM domain-containing protein